MAHTASTSRSRELASLVSMKTLIVDTFVNELRLPLVRELKDDDSFHDFGISSLEVIRLLSELERKLGIWIDDEHYARCTSVASIAQVCMEAVMKSSEGSEPCAKTSTTPASSNADAEKLNSALTRCDEIVVSSFSAITPLGIASPLPEHSQLWTRLTQGETAFTPITHFDPLRAKDHLCGMIASEVCDLPGTTDPERLKALAVTAVRIALKASGLTPEQLHKRKIALILGTTDVGGHAAKAVYAQYKSNPEASSLVSASLIKSSFNAFHAFEIANTLELTAKCITLGNASAASAVAIGYARDLLLSGDYDLAIALGADVITESAFQGLFSLRTLAPEGCRPFHPERRGIRISEGAGVLILERRATAEERQAKVLATLSGYAASHISENPARPDPEAITHAVQTALRESGLTQQDIGYINLHGAGTIHGDSAEINGLRKVFGDLLNTIPISSTKPSLGHCQGSAGIIEALVVLLSIRNELAPPTLGLSEIDQEFRPLNLFNQAKSIVGIRNGISISCGLGGTNTALVISYREHDPDKSPEAARSAK